MKYILAVYASPMYSIYPSNVVYIRPVWNVYCVYPTNVLYIRLRIVCSKSGQCGKLPFTTKCGIYLVWNWSIHLGHPDLDLDPEKKRIQIFSPQTDPCIYFVSYILLYKIQCRQNYIFLSLVLSVLDV